MALDFFVAVVLFLFLWFIFAVPGAVIEYDTLICVYLVSDSRVFKESYLYRGPYTL